MEKNLWLNDLSISITSLLFDVKNLPMALRKVKKIERNSRKIKCLEVYKTIVNEPLGIIHIENLQIRF